MLSILKVTLQILCVCVGGGGGLDREAELANAQLMQKMILTYREKQEQHT